MSFLDTIEGLVLLGIVVGVILGFFSRSGKIGCVALLVFGLASCGYAKIEYESIPAESLNSTAGLVLFFIPLWLCSGAVVGWAGGYWIKHMVMAKRWDRSEDKSDR